MVALLSTFREIERLRQIYVVLVRHGFADVARRLGLGQKSQASAETADVGNALPSDPPSAPKSPLAERVRLVAMDLGPSFVKLGQIASTRTDIIPADWIIELKKLQDEVSPLDFEKIREAIETSLGTTLDQVYASVEEKPLAAASIGQVHRAVLKHPEGNRDVVVKVQRPGARTTVASDLELLHDLARLAERAIPEARTYNPRGLVEQFDRAITSELDFLLEAENAVRFRKNFEGHDNVRFPEVYRDASSKQVLTLELLPGKKVYDAIADGFSGEKIAKTSVGLVIKMIFEDGFFHADPHPGNILVSGTPEAPVMGLIDLGMVGRLSPEMRDRCIDLMVAAGRSDHTAMADALYAISTPTTRIDMRAFRAEVGLLSENYLNKPLKEIELSRMIGDLVGGAQKFGLEIPPDFLLVGKALMTIEGVGKEIYPELDVLEEAKPYFLQLLKRRYSPERIGNDLLRGIEKLGGATYDLPQLTRELLEDARGGRLSIRATDERMPQALDRLGRRLFSGFVVGGLVVSASLLMGVGETTFSYVVWLLAGVGLFGHLASDVMRRWS